MTMNRKKTNQIKTYTRNGEDKPSAIYVTEIEGSVESSFETAINFLIENGLVQCYTAEDDTVKKYPDEFIEVNGNYIPKTQLTIHKKGM